MKTKLINKENTETYREKLEKFKFFWIFLPDGVSIQKHDEADYSRFLDRNYISKSNLDWDLSY
jgi:hypothetical protein